MNPLRAANGTSAEVVVENLVGLFKSLYSYSWGPRLDDILRAALLTLAGVEGTTLCEVPLILTNPDYRRRLVGQLDDPVGLESFWGWYESLSDAERQTVVGPVLNKVRAFTMRPTVRSIIGQSHPAPAGRRSGQRQGAALLAGLRAARRRSCRSPRRPDRGRAVARHHRPGRDGPIVPAASHGVLDEWQHFVHLPTPMASVLAEARGLGLGMTLAHQHLGQLERRSLSRRPGKRRSRVVFQLPADDARMMARELGGILSADDLQGLGAFEVVCQLFAGGTTQAPATGETRPLGTSHADPEAIRSASRTTTARRWSEVEQAIRRRQAGGTAGAIGRRARAEGVMTSVEGRSGRVESASVRPWSDQVAAKICQRLSRAKRCAG